MIAWAAIKSPASASGCSYPSRRGEFLRLPFYWLHLGSSESLRKADLFMYFPFPKGFCSTPICPLITLHVKPCHWNTLHSFVVGKLRQSSWIFSLYYNCVLIVSTGKSCSHSSFIRGRTLPYFSRGRLFTQPTIIYPLQQHQLLSC